MLVIVRGIVPFDNQMYQVSFTAAVLAPPLLPKVVKEVLNNPDAGEDNNSLRNFKRRRNCNSLQKGLLSV
jgi:hypothetical protein